VSGSPTIVACAAEHLDAVAAIYAREADGSPATFDLEGRSRAWWEEALEHSDPTAGHLLLVALDDDGHLLGYAKSGPFRDRPAYDSTVEVSAYVDADARGRGAGAALYAELLAALERSDALLAVAGITEPNEASVRLHRAHGFERVGTFHGVGVKFERAWDVTWYERPIAGERLTPPRTADRPAPQTSRSGGPGSSSGA
jgi:phosphinothricin acetyltransferase